jgi:hypothetical protein
MITKIGHSVSLALVILNLDGCGDNPVKPQNHNPVIL